MAEVASDALIGRVIAGKFRIERALGAGAMGRVYLAEQTNLGKQVAIKVLHANLAGDPALEKRFAGEAKSASALSHPNIVQTIDFGQEDGLLFIAMELLSGNDLGKVIRRDWPFTPERIANITGQVLSALEEAHEKGIVHRDLKPENIMLIDVRGEDFVKVCDFGIAKATHERAQEGSAITSAGMVCGTPEYMSPEQARGEELDGRSDLYAVACILYQMACGELPFRAQTALGVVSRLLTEAPAPPSKRRPDGNVPAALESLIMRGLAKDRNQRSANALAMRDSLFEAVGLKRPGSGQVRARAASGDAEGAELALAATGVATPASQPALLPTAAAPVGGSVHGEMTAATQPQKRLNWPALAAGAAVLALGGVILGRGLLQTPTVAQPAAQAAPVAVQAAPVAVQAAPVAVAPPAAPTVVAAQPAPIALAPRKDEHHRHPVGGPKLAAAITTTPAAPAAPTVPAAVKEPAARGFAAVFAEAEQLFKSGNDAGALARYLEAARLDTRDARTQRQIGKCYNHLGQQERAAPYLKRYLELEPGASDAAFIRAMIR